MGFEQDPYVKDYCKRKSHLSQDSINKYKFILKQFSEVNGESIETIINNCLEDQESRIEGNRIIEFSPNSPTSCVNKYLNNFEDHFIEKGNSQSSVNDKIKSIRTFLRFYDVKLPNWSKKTDDRKKWYPLSKEDLRFIISISENYDKAILTFMLSSGVRRLDVINFTIGDFMEATKEYHDFVDVDEFIDNAPDDMIGYWDFIPHKNKRLGIPCKTFNSRESSNLILQHLRRVKNVYMPNKNKKDGLSLKLEKSDALFGSREKHFKGHLSKSGLSQKVDSKYSRFKEWKIKQIDEKIKEGKIAKDDRDKEIDKITKLSCHDLRKYFINTIDSYSLLSSERSKLIMEGHKSKIPTDPNYIAKEKDELKEGYENALPYLTIMDGVNVKLEKETMALKAEINELQEQLKAKDEQISNMDKKHREENEELKQENELLQKKVDYQQIKQIELENRLVNVEKNVPNLYNTDPDHVNFATALNIDVEVAVDTLIQTYYEMDYRTPLADKIKTLSPMELIVLKDMTYELALEDDNPTEDYGEIEPLIKKAFLMMENKPEIKENIIRYHNRESIKEAKQEKYHKILYEKLKSMGLWDEDEIVELCDKISFNFILNLNKYSLEEINDALVLEDIEKYL